MATIEEILNAKAEEIAAKTEEQLKEWTKDAIALEPKPFPKTAVEDIKTSFDNKDENVDDDCPIKLRKKKKKQTPLEALLEAQKILENI